MYIGRQYVSNGFCLPTVFIYTKEKEEGESPGFFCGSWKSFLIDLYPLLMFWLRHSSREYIAYIFSRGIVIYRSSDVVEIQ